jgi:hypothetical protein
MDGWMDWRERNHMGKPVVLAFFVIHYYYFLCGRRAWETLLFGRSSWFVEKTRGLVLVKYLERRGKEMAWGLEWYLSLLTSLLSLSWLFDCSFC